MKTAWLLALSAFALPAAQCSGTETDAPEQQTEVVAQPEVVAPPAKADFECGNEAQDCECDCAGNGHAADGARAAERLADEDFRALTSGDAPSFGPASAAVTIVLFTDYQCPYCAKLNKTLAKLRSEYPSELRVVVRNLPLPMHDDARSGARAALAAHQQGRFDVFEEALYAHQNQLDPASLERLAGNLGLNETSFQHAMLSSTLEQQIEHDLSLAARVGARGTPTMFLNGRRLVGAWPADRYRAIIDAELGK